MLARADSSAIVLTSKLPPGLRDADRSHAARTAPLSHNAAFRQAERVRASLVQTLASTAHCVSLGTLDWEREPEPALVPIRIGLFPHNQPLDELEWFKVATCMVCMHLDDGDTAVRVELGDGRAETMVMADARRLPAGSWLTSLPGLQTVTTRGDAQAGIPPVSRGEREERAKHQRAALTEAGVVAQYAALGLRIGASNQFVRVSGADEFSLPLGALVKARRPATPLPAACMGLASVLLRLGNGWAFTCATDAVAARVPEAEPVFKVRAAPPSAQQTLVAAEPPCAPTVSKPLAVFTSRRARTRNDAVQATIAALPPLLAVAAAAVTSAKAIEPRTVGVPSAGAAMAAAATEATGKPQRKKRAPAKPQSASASAAVDGTRPAKRANATKPTR